MPDIFHDIPIKAPQRTVFDAVSTAEGLDAWWSNQATGDPTQGSEYKLQFGPEYEWRAVVVKCAPNTEFEIRMTVSDDDWTGTRVGFSLSETDGVTLLRFHHLGWPELNDHCRRSGYCWAMYLRCLKRYTERGNIVPYADRFDA